MKAKIKSFKRTEFLEMGRDTFDENVSNFLSDVGHENIIATHTVNYQHVDMATRELMIDYGLIVVYKEKD